MIFMCIHLYSNEKFIFFLCIRMKVIMCIEVIGLNTFKSSTYTEFIGGLCERKIWCKTFMSSHENTYKTKQNTKLKRKQL